MKKVGILAGTFDPIHTGHIAFARAALDAGQLDKVFFLVEPSPRHKQGVKSMEHRLKMVQLAIAGEDRFGSIMMDQTQFSVAETLPFLQARFASGRLYVLLGEDVLSSLTSWPHVKQLVESVDFIIGVRAGSVTHVKNLIQSIEKARGLRFKHHIITAETSGVSSSKVRLSLSRGHKPVGVTAEIFAYIKKENLYSSGMSE